MSINIATIVTHNGAQRKGGHRNCQNRETKLFMFVILYRIAKRKRLNKFATTGQCLTSTRNKNLFWSSTVKPSITQENV